MKWIILLTILICLGYALLFRNKSKNIPIPVLMQDFEAQEIVTEEYTQALDIIDKLNTKNDKLKNLSCIANIYIDGFKSKINISYEKKLSFRLICNKQIDIGSNENEFWFWSKTYDRDTVFYASHSDYLKTRLKTPFSPQWIIQSLGIQHIDLDDFDDAYLTETHLKLLKITQVPINKNVKKSILIDIKKNEIIGTYIYDMNDKLLVSSEWYSNKLQTNWYEENEQMMIEFGKIQYNVKLDENWWIKPIAKRFIDMSRMRL